MRTLRPEAEVPARDLNEHIWQDALEQYAMETLPESEIEPLEMHLLVCEACQDRLKHLDEFIAALRAAARKIAQDVPEEQAELTFLPPVGVREPGDGVGGPSRVRLASQPRPLPPDQGFEAAAWPVWRARVVYVVREQQ